MTEAAEELHLTQSGVSQHIKNLEDLLGVKLFDRLHRQLIPTAEAEKLHEHCQKSFRELEAALTSLKPQAPGELRGTVRVGLPAEFGNNVVIPLLSRFAKLHPQLRFHYHLDLATSLGPLLLDGKIDFALIDFIEVDSRIQKQPIYTEELHLCISQELLQEHKGAKFDKAFFENLPYIAYQDGEPVLRLWLRQNMRQSRLHLNVCALVADAQAVSVMILEGLGAGVLPNHLIEKLEKMGSPIQRLKKVEKPVKNKISLATLRGRTQSPASRAAIKFLQENLK